jgi:Domain of unknown function (DUF202)
MLTETLSPDIKAIQSSVLVPFSVPFSSTTQTAMPEIIAPMNEVLPPAIPNGFLPPHNIPHVSLHFQASLTNIVPHKAFLSYLRLSVYMAVVSIAIVISFHFKQQPTPLERRMSQPLGIIFWLLSLACLCLGFGNYMKTVNKYGRRVAIVQTGWKTQSVCCVTQFLSWCILL